jgi:hypothetical protein
MKSEWSNTQRAAAIGVGVVAVALLVWGLRSLAREATMPKRQVARIAVLPDTPPPPPPPPKERKEEPKSEKKPVPTPEALKPPPQAPAAAPLKMEGAAGNGPSAFAAGPITQDYRGGVPTIGGAASGAGGDPSRRAQERLYVNTVRQLVRDELERQLSPEAGELTAAFALWVEGSGRVGRWEIDERDTTLDPRRHEALKLALDRSVETLHLPAPQAIEQPMRFRLTVRAGG